MIHTTTRRCSFALGLLVALAAGAHATPPAGPQIPRLTSDELPAVARALHEGDRVHVDSLDVPATSETLALDLQRFEVFTPDADVVVHGEGGEERHLPRPDFAYFKGTVSGEPGSRVFLEAEGGGHLRGFIHRGDDQLYVVDNEQEPAAKSGGAARLVAERADNALIEGDREPFACDEASLPSRGKRDVSGFQLRPSTGSVAATTASDPTTGATVDYTHTARVAIETDFEFYQRFNSTTAATSYIGTLIGYASSVVYQPELSTSLMVSSVSLWTTSADPWTQTSTSCGLYQFGYYWNKNKTGTNRTIAHFLSGKSLGGGVAWIGVLCQNPASGAGSGFNFTDTVTCPSIATDRTWFGDYGFTANISGSFDINHPTVVWDLIAVAHEIGHNFDSPHSHCYKNIGGNANPIDACYAGEVSGNPNECSTAAQTLPGANSLTGGVAGGGNGTLMSYCHLLGGGYPNITMTFGAKAGFNSGIAPGREASLMSQYVASFGNAACLAPSAPASIFTSSFEGGPLPGGWSTYKL